MSRINTFSLLLCVVLCYENTEQIYLKHDKAALRDAFNKASMKLFKEVFVEAADKNVIASPFGIFTLLSLYASRVNRDIQEQIAQALGADNYSQMHDYYSFLSKKYSEINNSNLTFANKIYVSDKFEPSESFSDVANRFYNTSIEKISSQDRLAATAIINEWIRWNVQFDASLTKDEVFHTDKNATVNMPTMNLLEEIEYVNSKRLGATLIDLPYEENSFRMIIVLPKEEHGLPNLLEKMVDPGLLSEIFLLRRRPRYIDLYVPKFTVKSELDLNKLLPKVGVPNIFTDPAAGIIKKSYINVTQTFQKAFVKVDQEDAIAGVFSGSSEGLTVQIKPIPLEIKVDRPFLYLIIHEDVIICVGTLTH